MLKLKITYLFVALLFFSFTLRAQSKVVRGYLLDSITHFPIVNGTINNTTAKTVAHSDEKGFFSLQAAPNDFLYASAKSYHYDTLAYSFIFTDTITIYLAPAGNILENVTVTTKYSKYQLDSIERRTSFMQDMGKPVKTLSTDHPSGFGLTLNLDKVFKKEYKYRKRDERMFNEREKMAYIDSRFSPQIVAYYTSFKGDTLKDFLRKYSPGYDWLRQHPTNEDIIYYLNDKLKSYRALKR